MTERVRPVKGGDDRYTLLSPCLLHQHCQHPCCHPYSIGWLFANARTGQAHSSERMQRVARVQIRQKCTQWNVDAPPSITDKASVAAGSRLAGAPIGRLLPQMEDGEAE